MSYRITVLCLLAVVGVLILLWGTSQGWVLESWNPLGHDDDPITTSMQEDRDRALGQPSTVPAAMPAND